MYRFAMETLYQWKENKYRKPLIIEGARQVGKTWLMKEFGQKAYKILCTLTLILILVWQSYSPWISTQSV